MNCASKVHALRTNAEHQDLLLLAARRSALPPTGSCRQPEESLSWPCGAYLAKIRRLCNLQARHCHRMSDVSPAQLSWHRFSNGGFCGFSNLYYQIVMRKKSTQASVRSYNYQSEISESVQSISSRIVCDNKYIALLMKTS